jgi:hypothetical protein
VGWIGKGSDVWGGLGRGVMCGVDWEGVCCMGWFGKGCDVWGGVGGIVKTVCGVCLQFSRLLYLSGTPVHFCTYCGHELACL